MRIRSSQLPHVQLKWQVCETPRAAQTFVSDKGGILSVEDNVALAYHRRIKKDTEENDQASSANACNACKAATCVLPEAVQDV